MAIEEALVDISKTFKVPPLAATNHIKTLPKKQEMKDLQAQINCLVKENGELKSQMAARKAKRKQMEELRGSIAAIKVKLIEAQKKNNKAQAVARNFKEFISNPGKVVRRGDVTARSFTRAQYNLVLGGLQHQDEEGIGKNPNNLLKLSRATTCPSTRATGSPNLHLTSRASTGFAHIGSNLPRGHTGSLLQRW